MKEIMKTPKQCSMEDLLHIISRSEEIAWIQLRRSEKKILNDINCDKNGRLRFHILETNGKIKKRIQTREEKIFVLANDCLAGDSVIHEMTLNQDVNAICSNGSRIARCMKECFIFQKRYKESMNSMVLAKCLHQKLWDDSPYQLKQLVGVGMVTAKALYLSGIISFENLERADPRRLEIITSRKYPFGNHIKDSLLCLPPKIDIKIEEIDFNRQGNIKLIVTLTRLSTSSPASKRHFADLLIGSEEDNLILFHERISPYTVTVYTSSVQDTPTNINIDLISEEYVGVDLHEKFTSSKQENAKKHRHKAVEEVGALEIQPPTRFCNRQKKEEKLNLEPLRSDVCSSHTEHQDICSMPTFNLLPEEENIDDHEVVEEPVAEAHAISISDNEKGKKAKISGEIILQHIRRKARKLPSFETSLPCNSPNLRAVQLLPSRISNKNRRLESENQHAADFTTHAKRTKDDGTSGSSLDTIKTLSADLLVFDEERTRDLKFQEGNSTNNFSTPDFLIKGHNVASAETIDVPQSLSSIKHNAILDKNFPADSSSVITIEDSKTSGSSSPDDDIEISNRNAEDKSMKLRSESTESSTAVSSSKSNPKHSVTLAEEQTYAMPQQRHSIACKSHRVRETLTESQDLSISFLDEENGGPSFLGCQSVFSFL
eukprot:PITA_23429